jgi:hypothetical protein
MDQSKSLDSFLSGRASAFSEDTLWLGPSEVWA